mgnify:CR=1 FL=1
MSDQITVRGFVATAPVTRKTRIGQDMASFRLATTERRFDRESQSWVDGTTNWYTVNMFRSLVGQTSGLRRAGAASLDLAYVAAGRFDAFWESGLSEWDMAAGALLIQEAGGLVSDFTGGHEFLEKGQIVAGNTKCFKAVLTAIQPHLAPSMKR